MKLSKIFINKDNPRLIKDEKFDKLKKSLSEFPKMMEFRPIVINDDGMILGGNMRYKALLELGYKDVPENWVKKAQDLSEDEKRRFIIVDNLSFGDHDWNILANEWDQEELEDWGLDIIKDIDNLKDGEEIEIEQGVQLEPPKEYILILAEPNSLMWEDLKENLKLKMVRRGGYKKGSAFDSVSIERVIYWDDFKKRFNANSSTK